MTHVSQRRELHQITKGVDDINKGQRCLFRFSLSFWWGPQTKRESIKRQCGYNVEERNFNQTHCIDPVGTKSIFKSCTEYQEYQYCWSLRGDRADWCIWISSVFTTTSTVQTSEGQFISHTEENHFFFCFMCTRCSLALFLKCNSSFRAPSRGALDLLSRWDAGDDGSLCLKEPQIDSVSLDAENAVSEVFLEWRIKILGQSLNYEQVLAGHTAAYTEGFTERSSGLWYQPPEFCTVL